MSLINANPGSTTTKAVNPAPMWDVKDIILTLFNCTPDKGAHFYKVLILEEVSEVRDLYEVGTLGPVGIVNMFGGQASPYRMHLAVILTFTEFINSRVTGMVDLGRHPDDDTWIRTVKKGFRSAPFKVFRDQTYRDLLRLIVAEIDRRSTPKPTPVLSTAQSVPNPKNQVNQPPPPPPRTTSQIPMSNRPNLPPPPPRPPPQPPIAKMPPPPTMNHMPAN